VLASTRSWNKVWCPHAIADGNWDIQIRVKTPEFSTL